MTTRSKTLALVTATFVTGVPQALYTVPANRRTIIRSVGIIQQVGVPVTFFEQVVRSGTTHTLRQIATQSAIASLLEFWRVIEDGDVYRLVQSSGIGILTSVHVSGAELVV